VKRNGRVAIVETKIPEPKTRVQRIYQKLLKQSASFFDKYSDLLMPTVADFSSRLKWSMRRTSMLSPFWVSAGTLCCQRHQTSQVLPRISLGRRGGAQRGRHAGSISGRAGADRTVAAYVAPISVKVPSTLPAGDGRRGKAGPSAGEKCTVTLPDFDPIRAAI